MKTLIDDALRHALDERHIRNFRDVDGDRVYEPKIIVVGVGGAGNNCINRIHRVGIHGVTTVAVNTDKQHLDIIEADKKILIGDDITRGLGAGGDPEIGRRAAEESAHKLQSILKNADLVYVVCGEGGGTGTGAAPVVARIAKRNSSIVVGMVSFPFKTEKSRIEKARKGIIELKNIADTVIVLENDRLLRIVPHLPLEQAFSIADELICHTVKGICETITLPSLINLDFADIKSIMNRGGVAMMTVGEADGANRVDEVVKAAMRSTMLDVDFSGATGALIHITGGEDLTLGEANTIVEKMTKNIAENANVICGARIEPRYQDRIVLVAIVTGVKSPSILAPYEREIYDLPIPSYSGRLSHSPMQEKEEEVRAPQHMPRSVLEDLGIDYIY